MQVHLVGTSCGHETGIPHKEVIYLDVNLFHDVADVMDRVGNYKSIVGIRFANEIISSPKRFLVLLMKHRVRMKGDVVISLSALSFTVYFFLAPTEQIRFSIHAPASPWGWGRLFDADSAYSQCICCCVKTDCASHTGTDQNPQSLVTNPLQPSH